MKAQTDPLIGRQLANFRIDGLIKPGGMALVYYGHDVMLQRPVAIKIIKVNEKTSPATADRFLQEARVVAAWWHEHITPVYYADKEETLYYFVMEYINGLDLMDLIARYREDDELIPHADVLRIGEGVAAALDYAHKKGVIHRDVKPSNVLISKDGRVLLSDFGLALAIDKGSQGEIFGTPQYIAPEQAQRSDDAVAQSDLYSLAVTLYQMLTGRLPFVDSSVSALVWQQVNDPPPPPSSFNPYLGQAVDAVLLKALAKEPTERYQTGAALMAALKTVLIPSTTAGQSPMSLPPLPAAVAMADGDMPSMPSLSALSVVDRIALQLELDGRKIPAAPLPKRRKRGGRWLLLALLFLFLLMGGVGLTAVLGINYLSNRQEATAQAALVAMQTTATPSSTPLPTHTPSPTPSPQPTATPSPAPTKTATPAPTTTPSPVPTKTLVPTAVFTGPFLHLIYDDYSFYLHNLAGNPRIAFENLAFEALNRDGMPAGYLLQGRRWGNIYPWLEPDKCARVEPVFVPSLLRPAECTDYNASLEPPRDMDIIFWTPRDDVQSFRVYWQGTIIGYCSIVAGLCDVQLPK